MHWELWDADSGNFICRWETEAEGLVMVKEMLEDGWKADELALCQSPDTKEELATMKRDPGFHGETLLQRLETFEQDQADLQVAIKIINQTHAELKEIRSEMERIRKVSEAAARRSRSFYVVGEELGYDMTVAPRNDSSGESAPA